MSNYRIISTHKLTYVDARGNPVGEARHVETNVQVVAQHPKDPDIKLALEDGIQVAAEKFKPLTPEMRIGARDPAEEAMFRAEQQAR
jgi:hypothetical protein